MVLEPEKIVYVHNIEECNLKLIVTYNPLSNPLFKHGKWSVTFFSKILKGWCFDKEDVGIIIMNVTYPPENGNLQDILDHLLLIEKKYTDVQIYHPFVNYLNKSQPKNQNSII